MRGWAGSGRSQRSEGEEQAPQGPTETYSQKKRERQIGKMRQMERERK